MRRALIAALLAVVAPIPVTAAEDRAPRIVVCESKVQTSYSCRIGYYYRVELVREIGERRCIKSRTWLIRENRIVVTGGCSAEFAVFSWGSRS